MLRKLAAYERQNQLDVALQKIGKVERTLFMLDWLENPNLRRRCHAGLNNSEQRHALTQAIYTFRQGRIIDRSHEAQQYRASGLNLVIADRKAIFDGARCHGWLVLLRRRAAWRDQALRSNGKVERTRVMLDWHENPNLRRRCHAGLNNSEKRHALTQAIYTFRQGRIIDRSHEAQQYRASGLNLVIADRKAIFDGARCHGWLVLLRRRAAWRDQAL